MRKAIHNGWYVDALPNGAFACLHPGQAKIQTHQRWIDVPQGHDLGPLYLRLADDGVRFAGQSHATGRTLEWTGQDWRLGEEAIGESPIIFDRTGQLHISKGGHVGSQGYRFVDDSHRIWTGDETMAVQLPDTAILHKWTKLPNGILIGQGHEEGVEVWAAGKRRRLEPGHCTFVRVRWQGDRVAISIVKQLESQAVIHFVSIAELEALPEVQASGGGGSTGGGGGSTGGGGGQTTVSIPNRFDIVQAVDRAHPHLVQQNTRETCTEFYWRVTNALHEADPKFGMLTKDPGENHVVIEGQRVSIDAVAYDGVEPIVDILSSAGDGPGKGGITWGIEPHRRAHNKWLKPIPFKAGGGTGGGGQQPSEIEKLAKALAEVRSIAIQAQAEAASARVLAQRTHEAAEARFAELQAEIDLLNAQTHVGLDETQVRHIVRSFRAEYRVWGRTVTLPLTDD